MDTLDYLLTLFLYRVLYLQEKKNKNNHGFTTIKMPLRPNIMMSFMNGPEKSCTHKIHRTLLHVFKENTNAPSLKLRS